MKTTSRAAKATQAALKVMDKVGLEGVDVQTALENAYKVAFSYSGPYLAKLANEMLVSLKDRVASNPDHKVVFLGRDAYSLAIVASCLEPEFLADHCRVVTLSRVVVETAVQDLEKNAGKAFPEIHDFRGVANRIQPGDVDGGYQRLTRYLQGNGVPVGRPQSSLSLVDMSYKGTVQELLTAIYPTTNFSGDYAFFAASPHDPHPGTKKGYAVHVEPDTMGHGRPRLGLPRDPELTFTNQEAIAILEETMHGPLLVTNRIDGNHLEQIPMRNEGNHLEGFNPIRVEDRYADPLVREAVMDIGLLAVEDVAKTVAAMRKLERPWEEYLDTKASRFISQVRCWISRDYGNTDPMLSSVLDAFVRRTDKERIGNNQKAIEEFGLPDHHADKSWRAFDNQETRRQQPRTPVLEKTLA